MTREELEKEAEEYGHEHCCDSCKNLQARYRKVFKDGAEFGYNKAFVEADKNLKAVVADFNKANEWHYVKDGDLPKENKICLLYFGSRFNPITGWIKDGIWYFENDIKNGVWQSNVIAWKEIVPPKEIKENE